MAYEKPLNSLSQVNWAGLRLYDKHSSRHQIAQALGILYNWRAAHSYPLNAFHMTLKNRAKKIDHDAITAQRLKRYDSMLRKLGRNPTMRMSQMQDVGGCRAVVVNIAALDELVDIYRGKPLRHELTHTKNYVLEPKEDGYRGVHFMYRYAGKGSSAPWDKLRIELQLRTKLQHAWATAVETVDTYTGQDLKFGGGQPEWKRFFALVGAVHTHIEKTPQVPGTPVSEAELRDELRALNEERGMLDILHSFTAVSHHIRVMPDTHWYVLRIMPDLKQVQVESFTREEFESAKERLAEKEDEDQNTSNQSVMVSVDSVAELHLAYPNYFADTAAFSSALLSFLK